MRREFESIALYRGMSVGYWSRSKGQPYRYRDEGTQWAWDLFDAGWQVRRGERVAVPVRYAFERAVSNAPWAANFCMDDEDSYSDAKTQAAYEWFRAGWDVANKLLMGRQARQARKVDRAQAAVRRRGGL